MKVLVPVKRVLDYNVKARVKADQSGVDLSNVKMSMNPFDEIAVEEAVRLQEAGTATETIAVSIGPKKAQETIRTALAMGIDRGIHVEIRRRPRVHRRRQDPQGHRGSRGHRTSSSWASRPSTTTSARRARCSPPCSTGRRAPTPTRSRPTGSDITVKREIDGGLQTVKMGLPAIVTTDLRLNEPRYASRSPTS